MFYRCSVSKFKICIFLFVFLPSNIIIKVNATLKVAFTLYLVDLSTPCALIIDKKLNTEFFNWGYSDRDDCMIRCLEDGFQPNVWKIMKIMDLLIEIRNNPSNNIVYGKLFLILRAYKIKKLIRRIHSKKPLD